MATVGESLLLSSCLICSAGTIIIEDSVISDVLVNWSVSSIVEPELLNVPNLISVTKDPKRSCPAFNV